MMMATLVAMLSKILAIRRQQVQSPQHNWHVEPWPLRASLVSHQDVRVAETAGSAAASAELAMPEQHPLAAGAGSVLWPPS